MIKLLITLAMAGIIFIGGSSTARPQTDSTQPDIQIKKKTSFIIPGMPSIAGTEGLRDRPSTVYIKSGRMRTDAQIKRPSRLTGKPQTEIHTSIINCARKRMVQFTDQKKKFHSVPLGGESSAGIRNARTGGTVIVSGKATDTGERMKLFGLDARRLRQTITLTPGPNSCQKNALKIEVDGWYADLPEFSCPLPRNPREFRMSENCFDEVEFDVSGFVSGVPLKEIKTLSMNGMSMQIVEEAVEITRPVLADSLFEPPANYKAANTLKEVEDDSPDVAQTGGYDTVPLPMEQSNGPGLAPPKAGIEKAPVGAKREGVVRIGVRTPTAQLEKNSYSFVDAVEALRNSVVKYLGGPKIEVVQIEALIPQQVEAEAKEKQCDYVLTVSFSQKRGGGGVFGKLPIPGINKNYPTPGSMPTPGAETSASSLSGNTKAKDKFSLQYELAPPGHTASRMTIDAAAKEDGEDVMSALIEKMAIAVLQRVAG